MPTVMAASAYFDRQRTPRSRTRDRQLLNAVASLTRFTASDVADAAGNTYWYGAASRMLRALRDEGHVIRVSPTGSKPIVYRWADEVAS